MYTCFRLAEIPWLPIEVHAILTLHIHENFIPWDIFTLSRRGGLSRLAGTISYMYTETGGISRLAGTKSTLLRMCIIHAHHLHHKMDGKEQYADKDVAGEQ